MHTRSCLLTLTLGFTLASAALAAAPAAAPQGTPPAMPSLKGAWVVAAHEQAGPAGKVAVDFRLEFTRQEGRLLWADNVWSPPAAADGKANTAVQRDPMLGGLDPDGKMGVLTKTGARFALRLVDADHMEVEFVSVDVIRGVQPTAFHALLTREGAAVRAPVTVRPPALLGSWRSVHVDAQPDGPLSADLHLEVLRQDGNMLWINDIWKPVDPATGKPSRTAERRDLMIGSLDASGRIGVVTKEGARYAFELLDADRMLVEFVRISANGAPPGAFYSILRRNGSEPALAGQKAPDLRGTWEGPSEFAQRNGPVKSQFRLQVTRQDGLLLWVDDIWHPLDPATGKPLAEERRDPLRGSLHPDGHRGVLAKEGARFALTVLAPDRLLVEFVRIRQAGDQFPTAFYTVLQRQRP